MTFRQKLKHNIKVFILRTRLRFVKVSDDEVWEKISKSRGPSVIRRIELGFGDELKSTIDFKRVKEEMLQRKRTNLINDISKWQKKQFDRDRSEYIAMIKNQARMNSRPIPSHVPITISIAEPKPVVPRGDVREVLKNISSKYHERRSSSANIRARIQKIKRMKNKKKAAEEMIVVSKMITKLRRAYETHGS